MIVGRTVRKGLPVVLALSLAFCAANCAVALATELTIERICGDPDLSGPRLREIKISPDGSRVAYLRNRQDDAERFDLWVYTLSEKAARLVVNCDSLSAGAESLSDEEKANRERRRVFATGIVDYSWSNDGRRLLVSFNGDVYSYDLGKPPRSALTALTQTPEFETDARFSPKDSYVSFIREQNIFVIDLASSKEAQLTKDGQGLIRNGVAEFIAQEEMGRYTGYWWSDDEACIAYTQTDDSPVGVEKRYEIYGDTFKVVDERYPRAGTPNVAIKVGVAKVATGETVWLDLGEDPDIYAARVDWLSDSRHVAVQRESREQRTLDLLFGDAATGKTRVVLTETSKTWINLTDDLTFLKKKPLFVWSSERSGYRHLYLYDLDGNLVRPLTAGEWVVNNIGRVDEKNGRVYFAASAKSPLERHLYCVSLDGKSARTPEQITKAEGWHSVDIGEKCEFFVDQFSDPETPPQTSLCRMNGKFLAFLEANKVDITHPFYPYAASFSSPEFGTLEAEDGTSLHYKLNKPVPFDPDKKYPVVVDVYGGPGAQSVTKAWTGRRGLWTQFLVERGYVVFALDNRGSDNRGKAFEDALYLQLGGIEVEDQVAGAEFLKSLSYVDSSRIAMFGHSYGGYMTLLCLMKAPAVFRAGVSASPVTDWSLYDTHYTERFLGTPRQNADGYDKSSVLTYVDSLKADLLIVHGMADDNVLFLNSSRLFKALQDRGALFEMMTYPGSKHSLSGKTVQTHYYRTVSKFLDESLR